MALQSFPIDVEEVELVSHTENVTFRVSVRGGDCDYVLRLHRPGYNSIEELESERAWTTALKEAGIPVPDSLPTRHGEHYALIDIPAASEQRYAGMTRWYEGAPLSDYLETSSDRIEHERIYRRIGEFAAAMHNQVAQWKAPPGFTRRRLDLDGLLGESPHWGRFWEHAGLTRAEKSLLLRARQKAWDALGAYGERPDNFSLIHADLQPDNIVYNEDELTLIDFDDSGFGWHMYDLAAVLIEAGFGPDLETRRAALRDGYRERRPLAERDVDMLPVFLLVRGMAIIGWFHQRPEHAGSDYFEKVKNRVLEECSSNQL